MNQKGYTLVEVMVSLAIFMMIVVPLVSVLGSVTTDYRGKEYTTAASLLDRTYSKIKACPESLKRVERFQLDGHEWRLEIAKSGEKPTLFKVSVFKGTKKIETAQFYR